MVRRTFSNKVNIVYLDMDGVLADFDLFVLQNLGRTFIHADGPGADLEMWDFLKSVPNMYLHLEPTPYCHELVEAALATGAKVEILTAIPRRVEMPSANQDKIDWALKHLGPDIKVNFGPFSADKWKHAKPGDVLVDDRHSNIQEWINHGMGFGILHEYTDHTKSVSALKSLTTRF